MPFNLYVGRRGGRSFKTLRSPYDTRQDTERTVHVILADTFPGPDDPIPGFAKQVSAAPLGETVTHAPTGRTFRTEEA